MAKKVVKKESATASGAKPKLSLGEALMAIAKSGKYGNHLESCTHRTGFTSFDYLNGEVSTSIDGNREEYLGIECGKSILCIGDTGSGKTSLMIKWACHGVKKYADAGAMFFIFDFEAATKRSRVMGLSGMDVNTFKKHVHILNEDIYTETILEFVYALKKSKLENKEEYMIEDRDGRLDDSGKPMKILPPTYILIDSIAAMKTEDFQLAEKMNGLTSGGRNAIMNKELFGRLLQPCLSANIIVMQIAHVSVNMSIGNTPVSAATRFLNQNQAVSGGKAVQYYANLFLDVKVGDRVELTGGSKEKNFYGGKIKGFKGSLKIVKSRSSAAGQSCSTVFDQTSGYHNGLGDLENLCLLKAIEGHDKGIFYIPGYVNPKGEAKSFRRSNFVELYDDTEDTTFKTAFDEFVEETLSENMRGSRNIDFSAEQALYDEWDAMTDEEKLIAQGHVISKAAAKEAKIDKDMEEHITKIMERGDDGRESIDSKYAMASDDEIEESLNS